MRLIAHRGLTNGFDSSLENHPDAIEQTLKEGYDVEVDVRYMDGWYLGHDQPQYEVGLRFLEHIGIWVHCKNLSALTYATPRMHYFWHASDDYTLTSKGVIWAYPGQPVPIHRRAVIVEPTGPFDTRIYGCCSYDVAKMRVNRWT